MTDLTAQSSGARITNAFGYTAFVPDGDSRRDTAIILIGAAREHGLDDARAVRSARGGFYISDELADLLYDEGVADDQQETQQAEKPAKKKASGNRAAKNQAPQNKE